MSRTWNIAWHTATSNPFLFLFAIPLIFLLIRYSNCSVMAITSNRDFVRFFELHVRKAKTNLNSLYRKSS